jgi:hypothetical protein
MIRGVLNHTRKNGNGMAIIASGEKPSFVKQGITAWHHLCNSMAGIAPAHRVNVMPVRLQAV